MDRPIATLRRLAATAFLLAIATPADELILTNGETIKGEFSGGNSQQIQFVVDGKTRTFYIREIFEIRLGDNPAPGPPPPPPAVPECPACPAPPAKEPAEPEPASKPVPDRPAARQKGKAPAATEPVSDASLGSADYADPPVLVSAGTRFRVRLQEDVDTSSHGEGQTVRARFVTPVSAKDEFGHFVAVIPAGADATLRLTGGQSMETGPGSRSVPLTMTEIGVNDERIAVETLNGYSSNTGARTGEGAATAGTILGTVLGETLGGRPGSRDPGSTGIPGSGTGTLIPGGSELEFTLRYDIDVSWRSWRRGSPYSHF